jgi:hypothetical protein
LKEFAQWLSTTSPSIYIQNNNAWFIPTVQSIHIVGIGIILGSIFMVDLRVLGWAGTDQTLQQTTNRFAPWVTGTLVMMLITGILMVIGEPVRELITLSFWMKMSLVALGTVLTLSFQRSVQKHGAQWEERLHHRSVRWMVVVTFLIWICVILLGRLIAYDHFWGSWSPAAIQ